MAALIDRPEPTHPEPAESFTTPKAISNARRVRFSPFRRIERAASVKGPPPQIAGDTFAQFVRRRTTKES
jgi:hypothetical protein